MILLIARRHVQVFFRDRAAVFFSLLSALILFVLYTVFLGTLQHDALQDLLPRASSADIDAFVHSWMFASVVMISSMTTSLSALSVFVGDRVSHRFQDFLVSPITRVEMIASYLVAAFVVSLVMTTIVLVVSQVYLVLVDGAALGLLALLGVLGYVVVFCLLFSAIWSFVVTYVRSDSVFMSVGTIVGTAGGFLCGAFINVGSLPTGVVTVMNLLPLNPAATMMRRLFTDDTAAALTDGSAGATQTLREQYGMVLEIGRQTVPSGVVLAIFAVLFAAFVVLGVGRIGRRIG